MIGPGATPFEIAYVAVCAVVALVFAYKVIRLGNGERGLGSVVRRAPEDDPDAS